MTVSAIGEQPQCDAVVTRREGPFLFRFRCPASAPFVREGHRVCGTHARPELTVLWLRDWLAASVRAVMMGAPRSE